jgi:tetratricopeptide (TPR) repeat protein
MEGEAAYRQGDYDGALKSFEAVLVLKEGDPIATHFKGAMLLLKNEPREAIKWLEKARNLNGNHRDTVYLLACAYGRVGKRKVAMDYLRMALRLGYPVTPALYEHDEDLRNLLGSKDALQELVQQVRGRKQGGARERQESSDP